MRYGRWGFLLLLYLALLWVIEALKFHRTERTERISGSAGDVLEDDPVGRLKVFVYELPSKYNKKILQKDPRCLNHMFAAEIYMHRFLLSSAVRTLNPEEADWFYTPLYTTCDLTPNGLPLPFKSPRMMRSAIQLIASNWPYWNRTEGADHFFIVPHDFWCLFSLSRRKSYWEGNSSIAPACNFGSNFWTKKSCLFEGWFNYNSSLCSSTENAIPLHSSRYFLDPSLFTSVACSMISEMIQKVVIMQEVPGQQCGRTLRTILSLIFQRSIQRPTMKTCSEPSFE